MNNLHIRQQHAVTDPLQRERLLRALKIILEPAEKTNASNPYMSESQRRIHSGIPTPNRLVPMGGVTPTPTTGAYYPGARLLSMAPAPQPAAV